MSNKTFKFLSKSMKQDKIIDLLKSIYEHSSWVPQRLFNSEINMIIDKEYLYEKMKIVVDNEWDGRPQVPNGDDPVPDPADEHRLSREG